MKNINSSGFIDGITNGHRHLWGHFHKPLKHLRLCISPMVDEAMQAILNANCESGTKHQVSLRKSPLVYVVSSRGLKDIHARALLAHLFAISVLVGVDRTELNKAAHSLNRLKELQLPIVVDSAINEKLLRELLNFKPIPATLKKLLKIILNTDLVVSEQFIKQPQSFQQVPVRKVPHGHWVKNMRRLTRDQTKVLRMQHARNYVRTIHFMKASNKYKLVLLLAFFYSIPVEQAIELMFVKDFYLNHKVIHWLPPQTARARADEDMEMQNSYTIPFPEYIHQLLSPFRFYNGQALGEAIELHVEEVENVQKNIVRNLQSKERGYSKSSINNFGRYQSFLANPDFALTYLCFRKKHWLPPTQSFYYIYSDEECIKFYAPIYDVFDEVAL